MGIRTATKTTAIAAVALCLPLSLAACGSDSGGGADTSASRSAQGSAGSSLAGSPKRKTLPDLVGKGLKTAKDSARHAGFYGVSSHDALGRQRRQLFDRNWKVCFQAPEPGPHPTDTHVDLGAVRVAEKCPAGDKSLPAHGTQRMPDFIGKSVATARKELTPFTKIDTKDASGKGRYILAETRWEICDQKPEPGASLKGRTVTLHAVKYGEDCP